MGESDADKLARVRMMATGGWRGAMLELSDNLQAERERERVEQARGGSEAWDLSSARTGTATCA